MLLPEGLSVVPLGTPGEAPPPRDLTHEAFGKLLSREWVVGVHTNGTTSTRPAGARSRCGSRGGWLIRKVNVWLRIATLNLSLRFLQHRRLQQHDSH